MKIGRIWVKSNRHWTQLAGWGHLSLNMRPWQSVTKLVDYDEKSAPYFSIIVLHGHGRDHDRPGDCCRSWSGDPAQVTPLVEAAIAKATDVIGYIPYVARITPREGLTLHPSDNRVEADRAYHALELAAAGKEVLIVSSGDPGVFAMAAALFEVLEADLKRWQNVEIEILPGITAMLAAAARAGAPLGHDFCVINLSDNLKPWALIEKRLRLAAEADFAMAFYNPRSKSRPEGFEKTLDILKSCCGDDRPVIFARAVSTKDETYFCGALIADKAGDGGYAHGGSGRLQQNPHSAASGQIMSYTPRSVKD